MASVHTKRTVIIIDGNDISTFCTNSEYSRSKDTHDRTGYGTNSKRYANGLIDGTGKLEGWYDNDVSDGPRAVLQPLFENQEDDVPVVWIRRGEGTGSGKPQDTMNVIVTSYVESSPVAGIVTWSCDLQIDGDVVHSTQ